MAIMMLSYIVIRQVYLNIVWAVDKNILLAVTCYPFAWLSSVVIMECYRRWKNRKWDGAQ